MRFGPSHDGREGFPGRSKGDVMVVVISSKPVIPFGTLGSWVGRHLSYCQELFDVVGKYYSFSVTTTATYNLVGVKISTRTVRSNTGTASPDQNPHTGVMKFQFQPSTLTHRLPVSVEIPNQSIQIDTPAANFTTCLPAQHDCPIIVLLKYRKKTDEQNARNNKAEIKAKRVPFRHCISIPKRVTKPENEHREKQ